MTHMDRLGKRIKTIALIRFNILQTAFVPMLGALAVVIWRSRYTVSPEQDVNLLCYWPLAGFLMLVSLYLVWQTCKDRNVAVFQNGLAIKRLFRTDEFLWDEISAIQICNLHMVQNQTLRVPLIIFPIIPFAVLIPIGSRRAYVFESKYIFTLNHDSQIKLKGDARLFDLEKIVVENTLPILLRETAEHLQRGEKIYLHDRLWYTLEGLEGFTIKGTKKRARKVPIRISWFEYSGYDFDFDRIIFTAKKKRMISLPLAEVENLHVLKAIAPVLNKQDFRKLAEMASRRKTAVYN